MKCSKCKAEWTPGSVKSQLSTCPFCGAPLGSATTVDDDQTMPDVMVRIVEHFGKEILSQESKCLAAFKDFAPKLKKEQKILKIAYGEGISDYFLGCPVTERESHIQKARQGMNTLLSDEASLLVVNSFAMALGWKISGGKQEDRDSTTVAEKNEASKMLEKGDSCYARGNYKEAMKWYRKAADAGNASAMNNIGDMYKYGQGVAKDYDEATEWYRRAMEWYRKAADAGNAAAMNNIGYMYQHGKGVAKDYDKAMEWYRKAADAGDTYAMNYIGHMYKYGRGVAKDYDEAMEWYRKAADAGNTAAMCNIACMYEEGEGVKQDYGKEMEWYRKAADAGDTDAMCNIACMYEEGEGVKQDYGKAMEWYRKAADAGDTDAMYNIGEMYEEGHGVSKDYDEAMKWYRKVDDAAGIE